MQQDWFTFAGMALITGATAYACLAACVKARRPRIVPAQPGAQSTAVGPKGMAPQQMVLQPRAVSVFKPLCSAEPRLFENLATLCVQTHPQYQLLFGVRDPRDPAIAVVRVLQAAYPACDIKLVVDARVHGSNLKVSNLINMLPHAMHDRFVIADSDIAVAPDYLEKVSAPLADPSVGIVTCLYQGRPADTFWSRLGALFINTWFAPSVRVASAFGSQGFGFGATIAVRRDVLMAAGGFDALVNRLADDYWLGQLTRDLGLRTVLSEVCVITEVTETRLSDLWAREVRWLRTIRSLNPLGFAFTWITYTFPVLAIGLALARDRPALLLALVGALARLALHWRRLAQDAPRPGDALLAPLRDALLLLQWCAAWLGSTVRWRQQIMTVRT